MLRRVAKEREKALGAEHPQTLCALNSLSLFLQKLGKSGKLEAMFRQESRRAEKKFGPEDPNTPPVVHALGSVLGKLGKYEEAEAMLRRALKDREKVLRPAHQETVESLFDHACMVHRQKHYSEASELYHRASAAHRKVYCTSCRLTLDCDHHWVSMMLEMKQEKCIECGTKLSPYRSVVQRVSLGKYIIASYTRLPLTESRPSECFASRRPHPRSLRSLVSGLGGGRRL